MKQGHLLQQSAILVLKTFLRQGGKNMARRRLHMRKTIQVLRLAMKERLPQRVIARSLKVGRQTVSDYLQRAKMAGISRWEDVKDLTEEELEGLLFPSSQGSSGSNKP